MNDEIRMSNDELPNGWAATEFGTVTTLKTGPFGSSLGKKDYVESGIPLVNPMHIQNGRIVPKKSALVSPKTIQRLSEFKLVKGDVVLGRRGEMGRCAVVGELESGWLCGTGSLIVRPSPSFQPEYLQRFLSSPLVVAELIGASVGSTMVNLNQRILADLKVPLPPLPEQKRIADKLEAVLGRVDACRARLDRVPALLKRFRQSVLAAAASGQLTESWRESFSEAKESNANSSRFLNERYSIPKEWEVKTLSQLSTMVTSGSRGWADYYSSTGAVFIRAQNINADRLDLEEVAHVQLPDRAEGKRAVVKRNDLLITITGANVGKSARVKIDLEETYISQHIALVKLRDPMIAAFIELFLWAENAGRGQLNEAAYGGGKPGLNLQNIRELVIGLPSLPEQQEIVRRVEDLFAFADRIEARLATAQKTVERLTPATLAKAFRGELVPQDPNDEPASALLARLQSKPSAKPTRATRKQRQ